MYYTIDKIDGFGRVVNIAKCKSPKKVIKFLENYKGNMEEIIIRETS